MAGIVEIAERAGVSPATVSRALRGLHHVNERTRKAVIEAALHYEYPIRPDLLPRSTRGRTNTIGVIAPFISRWYFSQALSGVEQALREAGEDLLLFNFAQVDARQRLFHHKQLVGKVDGLIVISLPPTEKEFESILGLGIPVALLGVSDTRCSCVSIDDTKGAELIVEYLVSMGHREIAIMVGYEAELAFNFKVAGDRKKGFLTTLERHGIPFNPNFEIIADFDSRTSELAMDEFLRRKKLPTAVFCESDEMAFGVLRSIAKKGLRVPEDISVVGFDDHDFADVVGLTTVAQPVQFLGQLAASLIGQRIDQPHGKHVQMSVPTSLAIRSSVLDIT